MVRRNVFLQNFKSKIVITMFCFISSTALFNHNIISQTKSKQKNNSEIIDQDQKELEKAKKLKVKVRTKFAAFYDNKGVLPAKKSLVEKIIFDKAGNKKEQIRYTGLGQIEVKYIYQYNAKGNLTSLENTDKNGSVVSKRTSKFDKKGNEIERLLFDNKHHDANKAYFTYDNDNNLVETRNYSSKNELLNDIILKYQDGFVVNAITKDGKGNVNEEIESIYNSSGKLIKENRKSQGRVYEIDYQYDAKGNLIEVTNPQYQRFYTYNINNDLAEDKLFEANGPRQFKVRFTYLPDGLQKEEIRYNNDDKPVFYGQYKYEYYK